MKIRMTQRWIVKNLLLTVAISLLLGSNALGQEEQYVNQVRNQLNTLTQNIEADFDFTKTHNYNISKLRKDNTASLEFRLVGGRSYIVAGVCDTDCADLDLKLYDENDNLVAEDTETDSMPMLEITPRRTATFTLKVTMYKCSNNPCYYGITAFGD